MHVIRDGSEVVASLHAASQQWERAYDLEECAARWNADLELSSRRVGAPTDHFVFYEDLAVRPKETVERLLTALGLGWEPGLLEAYPQTARRLVAPGESWKENVVGAIRPSSRSRQTLSAEQRQQVASLIDNELYERIRSRTA